ncbi:MAG: TRAP transporter small permease subunit [Methyloligellaceae bacterium]
MAQVGSVNPGSIASPDAPIDRQDIFVAIYRIFSWCTVSFLFAFLINNYLTHWREWPGSRTIFITENPTTENLILSFIQIAIYLVLMGGSIAYVLRASTITLRDDSAKLYRLAAFIIRFSFWAVLLIGLVDTVIAFTRLEGILQPWVGDQINQDLALNRFRAIYVHLPLIGIAFFIAFLHKGLGFPWLALLVVVAELVIVLSSAMYSYDQPFFSDLVRFWYAALFLFASAHTLLEEGHVRVDLLYAGMSRTTKGTINAVGSIALGMSLCWVIVFYGMQNEYSVINAPILTYEGTQQQAGLKVKLWMVAFLAIFAISMLVQFSGYFLESMAERRGDPGKEDTSENNGEVK